MKSKMYLDGKYISVSLATMNSFTPGVFHARGVFETLRADGQMIHFIEEHVSRMNKGLRTLKIKNPLSLKQWHAVLQRLLKATTHRYSRMRLMVWKEDNVIHHAVMILSYKPPTVRQYQDGLKVCVIKTKRVATATTAYVKSLDYGLFSHANQHAIAKGFDDALLVNTRGNIFESTKANLFVLMGDQLLTPPLSSGCLAGITRQQMMTMGGALQIPVKERNITPAMLKKAKGAYLTNSLIGLIPVDLKRSKI